jgi:cytochrome P450
MGQANSIDLSYKQQPSNNNLGHIPGSDGLPWVGRTYDLLKDFYGLIDEQYKLHGTVFRLKLIGHTTLIAVGAEANRLIYLDPDKNFSAEMGYADNLGEFYGGGLLMRDFDDHKMHRRMFQTAFKNDTMKHYIDIMNPIMAKNIAAWNNDPDFHFFPNIKTTLLDIAAQVFLGIHDFEGAEAQRISQTFIDIAEGMMGIIRVDSPLLPFTKWRKGKQAKRYMEGYLKAQIPQRRNSDRKDIFSLFTRETDPDGNYFSDDDIAAHINFLLFAAHDTTTSNLSYIMQHLGQQPELQERARQQSLALGKSQLDYDDLVNMTEIDNIHHEALRVNPSVMMMTRRTIRECVIDGVKVPANTVISVPPQFTHTMPEYWDNPDKFDPDRFSPERAEHKRHPFQYIAFGGGAHKCIGMHFAGMIVKSFLHQMLLQYEWRVPEGYNPVQQAVPMPKQKDDLPLILTKR